MTHDLVGPRPLKSDLAISVRNEVIGFVYDPDDLTRRWVVEILVDGLPVGLHRADGYVDALRRGGIGDGCYGFVTILAEAIVLGASIVEARLVNSGETVGAILRLASGKGRREALESTQVRWIAGLRFEGWLEEPGGRPARRVRALVDGRVVAEVVPTGWTHEEREGGFVAGRAFHLDLPIRFADGKARQVEVLASDGTPLSGSPCAFVAYEDGLAALVDRQAEFASETLRAQRLDHLFPQSWPLIDVMRWQSRFPLPSPAEPKGPPVAVVMVGDSDVEASLASLEVQVLCGWTAACLPEAGRATTFEPVDLVEFLEGDAAASDIVIVCPAGTRFASAALGLFRDAMAAFSSAESAYCDLLMPAAGGYWPLAFPAFDYELCLERGYCATVFAMRRSAALDAAKAGSNSFIRLFDSQFDSPLETGMEPLHIPLMLAAPSQIKASDLQAALAEAATAHFRNKRLAARISAPADIAFPAIRVTRAAEAGKVSIVIPTRNRPDLLRTCLTSLEETVGEADCEVVIADNDSSDPEALAVLASAEQQGIKIVRVPGPFNVSRINNQAVAAATGRYLLLLNNDVQAFEPGWLDEMLSRIAEPDVGAVGPLLLWPSGIVQQAGMVLGPNFSTAPAFGDRMVGEPGYGGLLQSAHECSAVTIACLLTRRDLYLGHGGLDEYRFAVDYHDVDYCLKLRAGGYRIIVTPHAKLRHAGSSIRGSSERPDQKDRHRRELDALRAKWGDALGADPYYNPNLTLGGVPYSGLAWPPRGLSPRQPQGWPARDLPPGL